MDACCRNCLTFKLLWPKALLPVSALRRCIGNYCQVKNYWYIILLPWEIGSVVLIAVPMEPMVLEKAYCSYWLEQLTKQPTGWKRFFTNSLLTSPRWSCKYTFGRRRRLWPTAFLQPFLLVSQTHLQLPATSDYQQPPTSTGYQLKWFEKGHEMIAEHLLQLWESWQ